MTALIERITPSKLGEITIPLRRNLDALFFDIATQALGDFGLKKVPSFGIKKSLGGL